MGGESLIMQGIEVIDATQRRGFSMFSETQIRTALATDSTANLAALHNVLTMGGRCLNAGGAGHADTLLRVAGELLAARGVAAESGKLLKRAA